VKFENLVVFSIKKDFCIKKNKFLQFSGKAKFLKWEKFIVLRENWTFCI
jgi:hypothetical protein